MFTIAKNTFLETIRDRILIAVLIFSLLILVGTLFLSELSMHNDLKIITDLGLSGISIFGTIITLFVGTKLIFTEIHQRTVFIIFSKPVKKSDFIPGKWLGLCAVLSVTIAIFSIFFAILLLISGGVFQLNFLLAILFSFWEQCLLIAMAIFFSCFASSPLIALFCTLALFVAGHITEDLYIFAVQSKNPLFLKTANVIYHIVPNLEYFNFKNQVVYNLTPSLGHILWTFLYGGILITILLYAGIIIFRQKEF